MEESTRMVSGRQYGKKMFVCPPNDTTYHTVRLVKGLSRLLKRILTAYNAESDAERVIVFQTVILQRIRLVTGAKNICVQIDAPLNSWIRGEFDEILCDSYSVDTVYLGGGRGGQISDQHHRMFSDLVLQGNCARP